ncbi:MFS transporter [Sulfobacillus sp. hq2]|uniref:MFS transporter n=1 Tax=Sulfobacillus sp. hq2 TaxID=2039167 RepID=UPI000CD0E730|nr:MFS transporter [Sulfobacillus sp. hq2]POB11448.1 hypothetical protein CO251_04705 [Sulfobacillus sp. hq2]
MRKPQVIVAVGAGIFIGTYDMGALSVVLPDIVKQWHIATAAITMLGTSTFIGMIIGSLISGLLADKWGRRIILLLDFVAYGIAAMMSAFSPNFLWLAAMRVVVGIGVGADFAVAFPYLVEYAGQLRGRVMAWAMWAANFGMLVAYGVGALALRYPGGWRVPLFVGALLVVPVLWVRHKIPESAAWRAHHAASWWDIKNIVHHTQYRKSVLLSSVTWLSYQVSDQGLTLFLPLMLVTVFGTTASGAAWHSVLVKAITIPAALVTVALIDRWGRRPLQIWGFLGRALGLIGLGTLLICEPGPLRQYPLWQYSAWLLLVITYGFGALGPDKTTVITAAEQIPTPWRATAQAIAEASGRIGGIIGIVGYSLLTPWWGPGSGLLFFGAMALVGTIISQRTLPETKNLVLASASESS